MGRPRTPPDRKDINFSVKLSPIEMAFLDKKKDQLGMVSMADVLRELVEAYRTTFNLPAYQAEWLHADMQARGLTMLQYIQELLAKKYEDRDKEPPHAPAKAAKR